MMGTFDPDMFDEFDMYGGFDERGELREMNRYLVAIEWIDCEGADSMDEQCPNCGSFNIEELWSNEYDIYIYCFDCKTHEILLREPDENHPLTPSDESATMDV